MEIWLGTWYRLENHFCKMGEKCPGDTAAVPGIRLAVCFGSRQFIRPSRLAKKRKLFLRDTLKAAAQADEMAADVGKTNDGSSQADGAPNDMQDKPGAQLGNLETEQSAQTAQSEALYREKFAESQGMTPVGQNTDKSGMSGLEAERTIRQTSNRRERGPAQNPGQIAEQGTGFQAADTVLLLRDSESSAEASSKVSGAESGAEPVSPRSHRSSWNFFMRSFLPRSPEAATS